MLGLLQNLRRVALRFVVVVVKNVADYVSFLLLVFD